MLAIVGLHGMELEEKVVSLDISEQIFHFIETDNISQLRDLLRQKPENIKFLFKIIKRSFLPGETYPIVHAAERNHPKMLLYLFYRMAQYDAMETKKIFNDVLKAAWYYYSQNKDDQKRALPMLQVLYYLKPLGNVYPYEQEWDDNFLKNCLQEALFLSERDAIEYVKREELPARQCPTLLTAGTATIALLAAGFAIIASQQSH